MQLQKAKSLALSLMKQHGLRGRDRKVVIEWSFEFNRAKQRFGVCKSGEKVISLSAPIVKLNDDHQVEQCLLHEIAHALAGPGHGHDKVWRAIATSIGDDGKRCYDGDAVVTPKGNYIGTCPNGHEYQRQKTPMLGKVSTCGQCSRRFNPLYKIVWKRNEK